MQLVGIDIHVYDSCYLAYESKPYKMGDDREQNKRVYLLTQLLMTIESREYGQIIAKTRMDSGSGV